MKPLVVKILVTLTFAVFLGQATGAWSFAGEHGWYWLNYNDFPVTITLTVTGFFDDIKDYGIH